MQCPKCGGRGRVTSTFNHGTIMQRYRRCPLCDHRWKSWEENDPNAVRAKKSKPKQAATDLFGMIENKGVSDEN